MNKDPKCDCGSTDEAAGVAVLVYAPDSLSRIGVANMLSGDERVKILDEADFAAAEVLVVTEETLDEGAFTYLHKARAASRLASPPPCVVVINTLRAETVMSAIEYGMAAVLRRSTVDGKELVRTVLEVSKGLPSLPPDVLGSLVTQIGRLHQDMVDPRNLTLFGLTDREREILRLLADGHDTEEIATRLTYSESTVKLTLHRMMTRYNLNNRTHAVAFAIRNGVI
ncbi:response regulator transcription factor [Amycolatopsis sp. NPDC059027]|uniref:helix-turn-helix transcriptional regulator n=1 Tax=unclassified Amycolatopsis TaxID=2618356 RepID=UPI00366C17AA